MSERRTGDGPSPWRFDAAELADLYAAGALTETERAEVEARVLARDTEMLVELQRVAGVASKLAESLGEKEQPPTEVRAGLMGRLAALKREEMSEGAEVDEAFAEERALAASGVRGEGGEGARGHGLEGVVIRASAEGRWWPTGLPGVWGKSLYKSRRGDRSTLLVRCDPGALIPRHSHRGVEELIVIEGNLRVGSVVLGPGDYIRTTPGADHGDAVSPDGCVCLFFTSHGVMSPTTQVGMFVRAVAGWVGSRLRGALSARRGTGG